MPSPLGQKQPKVQKLEQVCCGLEQVLMQASPHSWYTWLAGHGPTAAAQTASVTGAGVSQSPRRLPGPGPSPPSCTQSPSISQTRGWDWGIGAWGPGPPCCPSREDSRQRPGPLQLLTAWPAMLQRREYSDSVAQLQSCWPGWAHSAMSSWQLCTNGSLDTLHSGATRVSSWVQVWAWAEDHAGSWGSAPPPTPASETLSDPRGQPPLWPKGSRSPGVPTTSRTCSACGTRGLATGM